MEFTAVESFDDEDLLKGGNFHDQMLDYGLNVLPFASIVVEYLTNS